MELAVGVLASFAAASGAAEAAGGLAGALDCCAAQATLSAAKRTTIPDLIVKRDILESRTLLRTTGNISGALQLAIITSVY